MFLSKDKQRFINKGDLFKEYSIILTRGGPGGKKDDQIIRKKEFIYGKCDSCGNEFKVYYSVLLKRKDCICDKCASKITNIERYGISGYNNREKAIQTCIERYGKKGGASKGLNKGIPKKEKTKKKLSKKAKQRYKNKENHPMYGKKHTAESKEKNRQSQLKIIDEGKKSLGTGNYSYGEVYSKKLNKKIKYRSSYEVNFINLLENTNNLIYDYENIVIPYWYDGKEKRYIPDYWIRYKNKEYLIEIKPSSFHKDLIVLAKRKYAEQYCKNNGMEYLILGMGDMLTFFFKIGAEKDFNKSILYMLKTGIKEIINKEYNYA